MINEYVNSIANTTTQAVKKAALIMATENVSPKEMGALNDFINWGMNIGESIENIYYALEEIENAQKERYGR